MDKVCICLCVCVCWGQLFWGQPISTHQPCRTSGALTQVRAELPRRSNFCCCSWWRRRSGARKTELKAEFLYNFTSLKSSHSNFQSSFIIWRAPFHLADWALAQRFSVFKKNNNYKIFFPPVHEGRWKGEWEKCTSHLQKRNKLLLNHLVEAAANLLSRCPLPQILSPQLFTTLQCVRRLYICILGDPPLRRALLRPLVSPYTRYTFALWIVKWRFHWVVLIVYQLNSCRDELGQKKKKKRNASDVRQLSCWTI